MRPVAEKFPVSQGFGEGATQGVDPYGTDPMAALVRQYGNYQPYGHAGEDIACPIGTPVYAMASGTVLWADWGTNLPGDDSEWGYRQRWYLYKGFPGIVTVIQHPGWIGVYAHLSSNDAAPAGSKVREGQMIGYSGDTGGVAPHLHREALVDLNYTTGGGLIYGRTNPRKYDGTGGAAIVPQSTTAKPIEGLFMTLSKADEQLVLDRNKKYVDAPISKVDEAVWSVKVDRGAKSVSALQELADCKSMLLAQQGVLAGLTNAIQQLATKPGSPVDLDAIGKAAEAGAAAALSDLTATVTIKQDAV